MPVSAAGPTAVRAGASLSANPMSSQALSNAAFLIRQPQFSETRNVRYCPPPGAQMTAAYPGLIQTSELLAELRRKGGSNFLC